MNRVELELDKIELDRVNEFKEYHSVCVSEQGATVGEQQFSYCCTPTGIGSKIEIICSICGAREDITNYDTW